MPESSGFQSCRKFKIMTATQLSVDENGQPPKNRQFQALVIAFALVSLAVIAGIVLVALSVVRGGGMAATVEVVRDLVVILLALELLLIGAAFTVLLIQIARFANLLQSEMRPIIDSSSEAVNTIRGTAVFVSQHVTEPVMEVSSAMAGMSQAFKLVRDLDFLRDLATAAASAASRGSSPPDNPTKPDS